MTTLKIVDPPVTIGRNSGHRGYIDNPRLFTTTARKPPKPRGHRAWLEIA